VLIEELAVPDVEMGDGVRRLTERRRPLRGLGRLGSRLGYGRHFLDPVY
jgi:hypothetical protein